MDGRKRRDGGGNIAPVLIGWWLQICYETNSRDGLLQAISAWLVSEMHGIFSDRIEPSLVAICYAMWKSVMVCKKESCYCLSVESSYVEGETCHAFFHSFFLYQLERNAPRWR